MVASKVFMNEVHVVHAVPTLRNRVVIFISLLGSRAAEFWLHFSLICVMHVLLLLQKNMSLICFEPILTRNISAKKLISRINLKPKTNMTSRKAFQNIREWLVLSVKGIWGCNMFYIQTINRTQYSSMCRLLFFPQRPSGLNKWFKVNLCSA